MNHKRAHHLFPVKMLRLALVGLFLVAAVGWPVHSARAAPALTIRVNTTGDTNDGGDSNISLREAILMVNGGTGGDGIRTGLGRALSGGEAGLVSGGSIGATGAAASIVFTDLTAVDTINVMNSTGSSHESLPPVLTSGVVINGVTGSGTPVVIQGLVADADILWLGWVDPSNTVNPTFVTVNNVTVTNVKITGAGRYGIHLESATNSTVSNCIVMNSASYGILVNGKFAPATGNTINNCTIGPNFSLGIDINRPGSAGTTISNNRIVNNAEPPGPPGAGLALFSGATNNLITGNVISGNTLQGIYIDGTAAATTHNTFYNNKIGTDTDGVTPLPNVQGIVLGVNAATNTIGGTGANQANIIAFNTESGVVVVSPGSISNHISGNSIFQNGILGIDLNDDKIPTPGVSGGAAGPNNLSLRPTLTKAQVTGKLAFISGTTSPNAVVELFTADPSPSGFGSGKVFCASVTAGPTGAFKFNGVLKCTPGAARITGTATLPDGSTSEFGNDLVTTPVPATYLPIIRS